MSDIQRYYVGISKTAGAPLSFFASDKGQYVLYADHVEAVKQARADERKNIVQMLRYNTIISIWLTAGDEQQRKEAEFVLHRISGYPDECDPRQSCASRTDGHWEACHAVGEAP